MTALALGLTASLLAACAGTEFDWQGRPGTALEAYQRSFEAALGTRYVETMRMDALADYAGRTRVLWLGDHHRDPLLHERHQQLLGQMQRSGVKLALGMEALAEQDVVALADFLSHRISLDRYTGLVRARWPESWLDGADVDCTHYRRLLLFAASSNTPVFALEPAPRLPLAERDARIAANVRAAAERFPDRVLVIVIGQAHLLGVGNLIERVGLPSLALGAAPPLTLAPTHAYGSDREVLLRSEGGVWFYADHAVPLR